MISLVEDVEMDIGSFCIEGPNTVFNFALTASLDSMLANGLTRDIAFNLLINGNIVATAKLDDSEGPSNLSLIYRGRTELDVNEV